MSVFVSVVLAASLSPIAYAEPVEGDSAGADVAAGEPGSDVDQGEPGSEAVDPPEPVVEEPDPVIPEEDEIPQEPEIVDEPEDPDSQGDDSSGDFDTGDDSETVSPEADIDEEPLQDPEDEVLDLASDQSTEEDSPEAADEGQVSERDEAPDDSATEADKEEEVEKDGATESEKEKDGGKKKPEAEKQQPTYSVAYLTHIQNVGWERAWVKDGKESGTHGKSLRLEALRMKLIEHPGKGKPDKDAKGAIRYCTHVQNIGWQDWKADGAVAGTSGRSLRLEAVKIELTGKLADQYDVYYRVHAQNFGWMGWACNGKPAGSEGYAYRLEALQVKLVKKGGAAPGSTEGAFASKTSPGTLNYRTHVQNYGWMDWKADGSSSGTTGKSLRLEALQMKMAGGTGSGGIRYSAHVQNIGWQGWKANGATSGTTGRSLRLEAVKIELTGKLADQYDVYYRVHAQGLGWMGWACNGAPAGTQGYSCRLEALQVKLVQKGGKAPGSTEGAFVEGGSLDVLQYTVQVKGSGWQDWRANGATAGTTGKSLQVEGLKAKASAAGLGIRYKAHVQDVGWQDWKADGAVAGSQGKRLEAIQVWLTGDAASKYDVYYRVHVQNFGWMGWAKNGANAGSQGFGYRIEAVQMKVVPKSAPAPGSTYRPFSLARNEILTSLSGAYGHSIRVFGGSYNLNSAAGKRLQAQVKKMSGHQVCFIMVDLNTGMGISYNPNHKMYSASTIKGPYVAAVNKYSPGSVNSYWGDIMKQTITVSSNEGYAACRSHWGYKPMSRYQSFTGTKGNFSSGDNYVFLTSNDLAKLWVGNYDYFYVNTNKNSKWCRGLYTHSSNSFINSALAGKYKVHTKPGWIASGGAYTVRNDGGIVMAGGHPYVVVVMSNAFDDYSGLTNLVKCIDGVHSDMVRGM